LQRGDILWWGPSWRRFQFSWSLIATGYELAKTISQIPPFNSPRVLLQLRSDSRRGCASPALSILLESYCNTGWMTTRSHGPATFNSPRVLLQRQPSRLTSCGRPPFNSPRVLLQREKEGKEGLGTWLFQFS